MMARVLITGGTGTVGRYLSKILIERGYEVALLSRTSNDDSRIPVFQWDYEAGEIDQAALKYCDYIIHLAGANIGEKRWTESRKQVIIDSRVKSAEFILNTLVSKGVLPKAFISASAIGYYGSVTSAMIFDEESGSHDDFLGNTCSLWEQAAGRFQDKGIRTVKLRTGIVLTKKGGTLAKMITPVKYRVGAILGSGNQYVPWIHIDDLCEIYIKSIEDSNMEGTYNTVAPEHLNYRGLVKQLGEFVKSPVLTIKIPKLLISLIFGRLSAILLEGSRVSSKKIEKAGFVFKHPSIQDALANLFKREEKQ